MKCIFTRILLFLTFILATYGAKAQTRAGRTACPGSVLTLTSTHQPINIVWQQAGVGISAVTPTYASSATTVAGTGTSGSGANQLSYPVGVNVDAGGNIYVADHNNNRIQKWAPGATGGTMVAGSTQGSSANQLSNPDGVYVDAGGNIYVADFVNHRIQKFAASIVNTYTAATAGSYAAMVTTQAGAVTTNTVTVNALPNSGSITGASTLTTGGTTTLSGGVSGDVWSSSNTSVATI